MLMEVSSFFRNAYLQSFRTSGDLDPSNGTYDREFGRSGFSGNDGPTVRLRFDVSVIVGFEVLLEQGRSLRNRRQSLDRPRERLRSRGFVQGDCRDDRDALVAYFVGGLSDDAAGADVLGFSIDQVISVGMRFWDFRW